MKLATRLFVEAPLGQGGTVALSADHTHFLRSVLRLKPGARLALFNGREGEWLAEVEELAKGKGTVQLLEALRPQDPPEDLWLAFAPVKRGRMEFIVEKATELGCSRLLPVTTQYTSVSRVNDKRLVAIAREAAEQCRRLSVPEIAPPSDLKALLESWPEDRVLLMGDESGQGQAALSLLQADPAGRWGLLIGPEGGFSPQERELLEGYPFVRKADLGPRILRADTAVVAGLTLLQANVGDW
ncbi:16S rRNA (uracil(1498)-N(3))-methyltransferase [Rhodovibrionaceae bacterium A322]